MCGGGGRSRKNMLMQMGLDAADEIGSDSSM